jgi:hypothetical protein
MAPHSASVAYRVCVGCVTMLTYLFGPLFGIEPGPLALTLGSIECAIYLMAIPVSAKLLHAR